MLVLTRKQGEKIRIGDNIVVTVVRTKGKAVRLGIQAPAHVPVLRGEIAIAIEAETHAAEHPTPEAEPGGASGGTEPASRLDASRVCCASSASVSGRGPLRTLVAAR